MSHFVRSEFPQQVSTDQASEGLHEIAFSNGASFTSFNATNDHLLNPERHFVRNGILNVSGEQRLSNTHYTEPPTSRQMSTRPARQPDYIDYSQRLRSYARWTRSNPGPICLCEAGFFFTNEGDLVRCFQCGIGLKDFSEGDDPLLEHVRYSGDCPYLLEHLGTTRLTALKDKCQAQQTENTRQNYNQQRSNVPYRDARYQTYEARLSSFSGWPRHLSQKPEKLAEAGLYYTGFDDHVRCFTCDGGLRRWDAEDDPWTEHCRWFPACPYVREKKGDDFIALVQASAEEAVNSAHGEVTGGQDLPGAMERMAIRDPEIKVVLDEHKNACLEMGYDVADIDEAVDDLRNMGTIKPTLEEIIDMVEVVKERNLSQKRTNGLVHQHGETLLEENCRLKSLLTCISCGQNNVNALFIPCTHHRMCMDCAEPLTQCPVCDKHIRQKIRTYLA